MKVPTISVLLLTYNPNYEFLRDAINSVCNQSFIDWELVIYDDGSNDEELTEILNSYSERDPRIKLIFSERNFGIAYASQQALMAASGNWVTTLDQDDLLTEDALAIAALELSSGPSYGFAYSNSCKLNQEGTFVEVFEKPDWSLERLRGNMYVAHLFIYSRELAIKVGGYREQYTGSQDHDLALRLSETNCAVLHIPRTLYIWRMSESSTALNPDSKPYAQINGEKAVTDHLSRVGLNGNVRGVQNYPGFYSIDRVPKESRSTSIVIPTRGTRSKIFNREVSLVLNLLESIKSKPQKTLFEILLVIDVSPACDTSYVEIAKEMFPDNLKIIEFTKPFNFSEKINVGVQHAEGNQILILNDDIELISENWLDQLVAIAEQKDVGAVGPLLFFENNLIQHGGHFYALGGATHKYLKQEMNPGAFGDLIIEHEVSGLTGAYLIFSKENWIRAGGFSEEFPNNFNDVDFCLKLRSLGLRIVFSPNVQAYHFESLTRKPNVQRWEVELLQRRWGHLLGARREPFGSGGKPPYFGMDRLPWTLRGVYKRIRRIVGNIYRGRRPIFKVS